jgi:hypothetical protein
MRGFSSGIVLFGDRPGGQWLARASANPMGSSAEHVALTQWRPTAPPSTARTARSPVGTTLPLTARPSGPVGGT